MRHESVYSIERELYRFIEPAQQNYKEPPTLHRLYITLTKYYSGTCTKDDIYSLLGVEQGGTVELMEIKGQKPLSIYVDRQKDTAAYVISRIAFYMDVDPSRVLLQSYGDILRDVDPESPLHGIYVYGIRPPKLDLSGSPALTLDCRTPSLLNSVRVIKTFNPVSGYYPYTKIHTYRYPPDVIEEK